MRLWSIHPKYLDSKGLVACWREGLLAQKVLMGQTKGYKNHPQLNRFIDTCPPNGNWKLKFIGKYLEGILNENYRRGYNFNGSKIEYCLDLLHNMPKLTVTKGQLEYEFEHLQTKLYNRDHATFMTNKDRLDNNELEPHPLFKIVKGDIEPWEILKNH